MTSKSSAQNLIDGKFNDLTGTSNSILAVTFDDIWSSNIVFPGASTGDAGGEDGPAVGVDFDIGEDREVAVTFDFNLFDSFCFKRLTSRRKKVGSTFTSKSFGNSFNNVSYFLRLRKRQKMMLGYDHGVIGNAIAR